MDVYTHMLVSAIKDHRTMRVKAAALAIGDLVIWESRNLQGENVYSFCCIEKIESCSTERVGFRGMRWESITKPNEPWDKVVMNSNQRILTSYGNDTCVTIFESRKNTF